MKKQPNLDQILGKERAKVFRELSAVWWGAYDPILASLRNEAYVPDQAESLSVTNEQGMELSLEVEGVCTGKGTLW